ncbi:MAG TPA: hypothetical protein VN442_12385, partial [Bryobacteraceae bacterium]|nr:hypothetical protein [Bryobacteraceae bacterium]
VIPQTGVTVLSESVSPPSHRAVRYAHDFGSLPPFQLSGRRLQYHFLCFHDPFHFRGRELLLECFHTDQLFPTISEPDNSLAN